jgi:hypothetical protein
MIEETENKEIEQKPKHPGGRSLKFENAADLERKIGEYFEWAAENDKPLTIGRLCCFLDCDRDTLLNYSEKEEFFGTIKRAKQKIEASKEERLQTQAAVAGIIFDLKNNHGWKDQKDIVSGGKPIQGTNVNIIAPAGASCEGINGLGPEIDT